MNTKLVWQLKQWGSTFVEILKWVLVVWMLWPLFGLSQQRSISLTRVILGIMLFVIFSGKILFDTIIMDYIRQKRTTLKQDVIALVGLVAAVCLLVLLVALMVAAYLTTANKILTTPGSGQ